MNKLYTHLQIIKKEDAKQIILEILNQYPEGATIDDISEQIHIDQKHLNTTIAEMIENGTIQIENGRYYVIIQKPGAVSPGIFFYTECIMIKSELSVN